MNAETWSLPERERDLRHEERGEAEERLRQRLKLESQLAEQKMKVALLKKQSEFEKREATLEKELLAKDLESRSRLLLSQSQQTSPKTDEREGLSPLIDIEESGSPPIMQRLSFDLTPIPQPMQGRVPPRRIHRL